MDTQIAILQSWLSFETQDWQKSLKINICQRNIATSIPTLLNDLRLTVNIQVINACQCHKLNIQKKNFQICFDSRTDNILLWYLLQPTSKKETKLTFRRLFYFHHHVQVQTLDTICRDIHGTFPTVFVTSQSGLDWSDFLKIQKKSMNLNNAVSMTIYFLWRIQKKWQNAPQVHFYRSFRKWITSICQFALNATILCIFTLMTTWIWQNEIASIVNNSPKLQVFQIM